MVPARDEKQQTGSYRAKHKKTLDGEYHRVS
jgi:hypothetical protein